MNDELAERIADAMTKLDVGPPPLTAIRAQERRRRRRRVLVASVVASVALAGGSLAATTLQGADDSDPANGRVNHVPHLLTVDLSVGPGSMATPIAPVGGVLRVNDHDCFALDDLPLVVPKGSSALPDGSGLVLPSGSVVRLGEEVSGVGAIKPITSMVDTSQCADARQHKYVLLSALASDFPYEEDN